MSLQVSETLLDQCNRQETDFRTKRYLRRFWRSKALSCSSSDPGSGRSTAACLLRTSACSSCNPRHVDSSIRVQLHSSTTLCSCFATEKCSHAAEKLCQPGISLCVALLQQHAFSGTRNKLLQGLFAWKQGWIQLRWQQLNSCPNRSASLPVKVVSNMTGRRPECSYWPICDPAVHPQMWACLLDVSVSVRRDAVPPTPPTRLLLDLSLRLKQPYTAKALGVS